MRRLAVLLMSVLPCIGLGHDVVVNRLTLVQREANHLSMTLVIDYVTALNAAAAPAATYKEFVIACAAMPEAQLQRTVAQAQAALEQGLVLRDRQQRRLRVTPLHWPAPAEARRLLQQAAMTAVALGTDKPEPTALELTADVVSAQTIEGVEVQLPPALPDMLVVSYKPVQTRVDPHSHKAAIKF